MKLETFFEKFDQFADAPDAVAKMRELVLLWAVQGKLVVSKGDSASGLLAAITARNEDHAADCGAKNPESEKSKNKTPDPLPCPLNWMTVPLHRLTDWRYPISYGVLKPGEFDPNGVPLVKSQNVLNGSVGGNIDFKITPQLDEEYKRTHLKGGEILLNVVGSLGRCAVVPQSLGGANVSRAVAVITLDRGLSAEYIELQLRALLSVRVLADLRTGSAQPVLNLSIVRQLPINLPPVAEQKRIVAKVDELMALCDLLQAQQQERETRHAALTRASLSRFADAPTPANLNFIFHKSYAIPPADLRKSILTLAVQGKLVSFEVESDAQTVGDHIEFQNGYAFKSQWFKPNGMRLCRNVNVSHGVIDWRESVFVDNDVAKQFDRFALSEGDIVLSLDRPLITTGLKVARIRKSDLPCLLLQRVAKPVPKHDQLDMSYFLLWLNSSEFVDSIDPGRSNGVPHISTKQVQLLPFVLPPLAEQRRIVAKVGQLMALVDALETQLAASRATAASLLSALVDELTAVSARR
jgi:type I restriction enzyme, S subunit